MEFVRDDMAFADLAPTVVRQVVRRLIRGLAEGGKISIADGLSEEDPDLVSDLAFSLLLLFDDQRGQEHDGRRYPVVVTFADFDSGGPFVNPVTGQRAIFGGNRTEFHGTVTFEMIDEIATELLNID